MNLPKTLRLHLKYLVLTGAQTSLTGQLESSLLIYIEQKCLATTSVTPVRRATWIKSKVSFIRERTLIVVRLHCQLRSHQECGHQRD